MFASQINKKSQPQNELRSTPSSNREHSNWSGKRIEDGAGAREPDRTLATRFLLRRCITRLHPAMITTPTTNPITTPEMNPIVEDT